VKSAPSPGSEVSIVQAKAGAIVNLSNIWAIDLVTNHVNSGVKPLNQQPPVSVGLRTVRLMKEIGFERSVIGHGSMIYAWGPRRGPTRKLASAHHSSVGGSVPSESYWTGPGAAAKPQRGTREHDEETASTEPWVRDEREFL